MKKNFRRFFGWCMFIGVLILFGSAGASDANMITLKEIIVWNGIGLSLLLIGFTPLKICGCL